MNALTPDYHSFFTPLGEEVHAIADRFCQQQADFARAERVYLDTLAVYAVNEWLRSLGIVTDWLTRVRGNALALSCEQSADLMVGEKGKLACYAVLPDREGIEIDREISPGRIGYAFVAIDGEMAAAELLGGVGEVIHSRLAIGQLWTLDVFRDYLTSNSWEKSKLLNEFPFLFDDRK